MMRKDLLIHYIIGICALILPVPNDIDIMNSITQVLNSENKLLKPERL